MKGTGRWFLLAIVLIAIGLALRAWVARDGARGGTVSNASAEVERVVPDSVRIRVEVLNATTIRGLARTATFHLRDLGFDVVGSGNSAERHDSSVVIVRSGRTEWGELAAKALGGARVESRPDTSRYVDLTILLGTGWRPPAETFHP